MTPERKAIFSGRDALWMIACSIALAVGSGGIRLIDAALDRADVAAEAAMVYGKTPDQSKPWDPEACTAIAAFVGVQGIAKRSGGRKSAAMLIIGKMLADQPYGDEMLGELSLAWDKGSDPSEWLVGCVAKFVESVRRKETETGT